MDNSLYTGISTNWKRRIQQHFSSDPQAAKYTRSHPPKELVALWETESKSLALKLEYRIKCMNKSEKEELVISNDLSSVKKIDPSNFTRLPIIEGDHYGR